MVTLLLNLAPAHEVMQIMGHKDIRSNMACSRFSLDKGEARQLVQGAIKPPL